MSTTRAPLAQVAESVGYGSEAAVSRAFKKAFGVAAATWRRQGGATGPIARADLAGALTTGALDQVNLSAFD